MGAGVGGAWRGRSWGGLARVRVFSKKLLRCGGVGEEGERGEGRGVRAGREASGVGSGAAGGGGGWRGVGGGEGGAISGQPAPRGGGLARDSLGRIFGRVGEEGWGWEGAGGMGRRDCGDGGAMVYYPSTTVKRGWGLGRGASERGAAGALRGAGRRSVGRSGAGGGEVRGAGRRGRCLRGGGFGGRGWGRSTGCRGRGGGAG